MSNNMAVYGKGRIRPFPVFLSLLVPGSGEMYQGYPARALLLWLIRIFIPLFIPAYLFDSRINPAYPFLAGILILLLSHIYSMMSSASLSRISRDFESPRRSGIAVCFFYFFLHFVSFFLSLMFLLSSVHPKVIKKGIYPVIPPGDIIFVSKRSADVFLPGDLILDESGAFVRIIAAGESYIEYSGGVFKVDGALLKQTPPDSAAVKSSADEEVFSENTGSILHLVARSKSMKKDITSYSLKNGELLVIPDDRRSAMPSVIKKDAVSGLVTQFSSAVLKGVIK
jgi:hypothetical protein